MGSDGSLRCRSTVSQGFKYADRGMNVWCMEVSLILGYEAEKGGKYVTEEGGKNKDEE